MVVNGGEWFILFIYLFILFIYLFIYFYFLIFFLKGFDWSNVFLAGGAVLGCLLQDDEARRGHKV